MGSTALDNNVKMRYYGNIVKRILIAHITQQFPDLHTYLNKRIHATGQNLSKMFKKSFNHQVVFPVKI